MSKVIDNNRITREQQFFFMNGTQIPGVQSISIAPEYGKFPLKYLGVSNVQFAPNGPQIGNISINSLLISNDQFLQYTGNLGFNGYVLKTIGDASTNYSFISGYMTSYTSTCSIGEIPQISAEITAYGKVGRIDTSEITNLTAIKNNPSNLLLKIPGPGSISVSIDDFTNNRIQSYSLSIKTPRNPIYYLGNRNPYSIELNYPLEVNASFAIEPDTYTPLHSQSFPCTNKTRNLTLTIKDYDNDATIVSYGFSALSLINENYSTNIDGNVTMNIDYQGFLTR